MAFRRKKTKRLYYPVKSSWYTKPRRKPSVKKSNPLLKKGVKGLIKHFKAKSLGLFITVIVFLVVIVFMAFSSYFSITSIEVIRKNFNIDSAAIENELNQYIGENIIFLSRNKILETIQQKFPEFENINIQKVFPSEIKVGLNSYPIVANLRAYYILPKAVEVIEEEFTELNKAIEELSGTDPTLNVLKDYPLQDENLLEAIFDIEENKPDATEQKSLLNRIGQAIFDQEENLELFTISVYELTQPVEDREQVIKIDHMDYILGSIQYYQNLFGTEARGVRYFPAAREIHLKVEDNLLLWISTEWDYKEQLDKLSSIYDSAGLAGQNLSYIDLRIREKVIYCPRYATCDKERKQTID